MAISHNRLNLVFAFIILFSAVILGGLIYIQIFHYQYWRALAQGQQKSFISLQGERGEIFFQDKTPLVINQDSDLVYAAPNEIKEPEEIADIISSTLNLDRDLILEKLKKDSFYDVIKKKISQEELSNLKKINLPGIYLGQESIRYYPFETLASQTVGFLGGEGNGQYGIEGYYDGILRGKEEVLEREKGPGGYWIKKNINSEENSGSISVNGFSSNSSDIILTLDYNIQFVTEKLLEKAKEDLGIERGEIIVIEPNSGRILALANFPNFNPGKYSEVTDLEIFQNAAIQKVFEPGSIFKPITLAAALDKGKIEPQTTYKDEGFVQIGGYTIYNYDNRVWGERSMIEVLEKSINTGAVFAEQQMGHDIFLEYIEKFGLFEKTDIDLQGEIFSQNSGFKKGYEINFTTASFGQGIEMTSIQLVRAYSAIVNGGKLIKPFLVEKIIKPDKIIEIQPEIQDSSVISQKTASRLSAMLVSVVENGFGKAAKIPGYYIGGKTGTAQIPWSSLGINKKGYSEKTIQSFVGFAPAFNPRFLILVKLNNPRTKTAEYSAVPIFRELAQYIINLWQIPPDYE